MTKHTFLCLYILLQSTPTLLSASPFVDIQTNHGTIKIELNSEEAPVTVSNFLNYVNIGFYDNTLFHRIIDGFMIQGGEFSRNLVQQTTMSPILLESYNGLKNQRGAISMARTPAPNSATSQFFINTVDNDFLDYQEGINPGYAVFGSVIEGMEIVDSISAVKTSTGDTPIEEVLIETIRPREGDLKIVGLQENYAFGNSFNVRFHYVVS